MPVEPKPNVLARKKSAKELQSQDGKKEEDSLVTGVINNVSDRLHAYGKLYDVKKQ